MKKVDDELSKSGLILIFVGKRFDDYMKYESMRTATLAKKRLICVIDIGGRKDAKDMPEAIRDHLSGAQFLKDNYTDRVPLDAIRCAKEILETLKQSNHPVFRGRSLTWTDEHLRYGLPASPHIFDYEKD